MDPVEERSRREYASRMERIREGGRRVRGSLILELLRRMSLVKVVAAALILGAGAGAVVVLVMVVEIVDIDAAVMGGAGLDRAAVLLSGPPPPRVGEGEGSRDRGALLLEVRRLRPRGVHVPSLEGGVVAEAVWIFEGDWRGVWGVDGRRVVVDGEAGDSGRRKGDVRGDAKERGDGLYTEG